jgi:hypothetical protein
MVPLALLAAGSIFAASITNVTGEKGLLLIRAAQYPYCKGSFVTISGSGFVTDGGVSSVSIGGVPPSWYEVGSDSVILAYVGANAQSGLPVTVTTPAGTATSGSLTLTVTPCASSGAQYKPYVASVRKYVKGGQKLQIQGAAFIGTQSVTFGGVAAPFSIPSDANMYVIIPKTAKNGNDVLKITNNVGSASVTLIKTG